MSSILDFLNIISTGHYGRDVRQAIVDAINQCYEDGVAGVTDLEARQLIEAVMAVNEDQEASLDSLDARVAELEGGSSSSSTTDTTTTEVPTFLVDSGTISQISVNNNAQVTRSVTFTTEFTEAPIILLSWGKQTGGASAYSKITCCLLYETISTTGFNFFISNTSGSQRSPTVTWIALQPTTTTINTEITVPATDDLTAEQIAALIALLD